MPHRTQRVEGLRRAPGAEVLLQHALPHGRVAFGEDPRDAYRLPEQEDRRADDQQRPRSLLGCQRTLPNEPAPSSASVGWILNTGCWPGSGSTSVRIRRVAAYLLEARNASNTAWRSVPCTSTALIRLPSPLWRSTASPAACRLRAHC